MVPEFPLLPPPPPPPLHPIAPTAIKIVSILSIAVQPRRLGTQIISASASVVPAEGQNSLFSLYSLTVDVVVEIVSVDVCVPAPLIVSDAGERLHVGGSWAATGLIEQLRLTVPINPFEAVKVMGTVLPVVAPGSILRHPGARQVFASVIPKSLERPSKRCNQVRPARSRNIEVLGNIGLLKHSSRSPATALLAMMFDTAAVARSPDVPGLIRNDRRRSTLMMIVVSSRFAVREIKQTVIADRIDYRGCFLSKAGLEESGSGAVRALYVFLEYSIVELTKIRAFE